MATINNVNLAVLSEEEIRKLLSDAEIERIYRIQQLDYRTQDVDYHAEDMYNNEFITEDQMNFIIANDREIAERYLDKYHDCSLAENDVFESLIENYLEDYYEG